MRDVCFLLIGIASEIIAFNTLKVSSGFTRFWPSVVVFLCYPAAFLLLAEVLKKLPAGAVYATWAGLGTAGTVLVGSFFFNERLTWHGWLGIGLVIAGVVLLGIHAPANH